MKNLISILLFLPFIAVSQPDFTPITNALKAGNANALSAYLDKSVEITLLDKEDIYDKASAIKVINDFFSTHKPTACSLIHKGTSDDKVSHYAIGTLTAGGKNYRLYIYVKQAAGQNLVQELRFENE